MRRVNELLEFESSKVDYPVEFCVVRRIFVISKKNKNKNLIILNTSKTTFVLPIYKNNL